MMRFLYLSVAVISSLLFIIFASQAEQRILHVELADVVRLCRSEAHSRCSEVARNYLELRAGPGHRGTLAAELADAFVLSVRRLPPGPSACASVIETMGKLKSDLEAQSLNDARALVARLCRSADANAPSSEGGGSDQGPARPSGGSPGSSNGSSGGGNGASSGGSGNNSDGAGSNDGATSDGTGNDGAGNDGSGSDDGAGSDGTGNNGAGNDGSGSDDGGGNDDGAGSDGTGNDGWSGSGGADGGNNDGSAN